MDFLVERLRRCFFLAGVVVVTSGIPLAVSGDEFTLRSTACLIGDWVNEPEHCKGEPYVIRLASGGQISVAAEMVADVKRETPAAERYRRRVATVPDRADAQWRLSQWCLENGLMPERRDHLRRVVQLDPQRIEVWHALGYSQIHGQWVRRGEFLRERGYVLYKGRWRMPQEVALVKEKEQARSAEQRWLGQLQRWRDRIVGDDPKAAQQALAEVRALREPEVIGPLGRFLAREKSRMMRLLYIQVLAELDDVRATSLLLALALALRDRDDEIFFASVDELKQRSAPPLVRAIVDVLKHRNNNRVNRAAYLLGQLGDPSAISPLIDALTTTHYQFISGSRHTMYSFVPETPGMQTPSLSGRTQIAKPMAVPGIVGFAGGNPGPQISAPRKPQVIPYQRQNQQVHDALVRLSGGVSFGFHQNAWRKWHAHRQSSQWVDFTKVENDG